MKDKYGNTIDGNYGQHITPATLFNPTPRNPFYNMAKPYVENIYNTSHESPGSNFGAVQIKGGNLPDSEIYATRSKGPEFGAAANQDPSSWSGQRFYHSERTGLNELLNKRITDRRQDENNPLPYNPYLKHSANNIRRPSSPSPKEYLQRRDPNYSKYEPNNDYDLGRLPDISEFEALNLKGRTNCGQKVPNPWRSGFSSMPKAWK